MENQVPLAVAIEVVVPGEQVFGERIEVKRVGLGRLLSNVLEGRRQSRLSRAVVGVEENEPLVR